MDDLKHDLPRPDGNGPHGQIGAGFVSALPPPKKVQMTDLQRPAAAVQQQKREKSIELRQPGGWRSRRTREGNPDIFG
jgi:hypothetical protein